MARRSAGLALAVAALVASLATGELLCRADLASKRQRALNGRDPSTLATTAVPGPRLYGLKPDPDRGINSWGFRDLERTTALAPGTMRLAVIGDSVSVQPEIPFDKLWVRRLQRRLDRRLGTGRIELVNFAVTGYGTRQQVALLEEVVLGAAPDALLWQFHLNDAMDPVVDGPDGGLGVYYARPRSCLLLTVNKIFTRWRRSAVVRVRGLGELPVELRVQVGEWRAMDEALREARDRARRHGLEVFLFVLPTWPDGELWPEEPTEAAAVRGELIARFEALGFATLDLTPALRALPPAATRGDAWHPSAAGHRVIAAELERWLVPRLRSSLKVKVQSQRGGAATHSPAGPASHDMNWQLRRRSLFSESANNVRAQRQRTASSEQLTAFSEQRTAASAQRGGRRSRHEAGPQGPHFIQPEAVSTTVRRRRTLNAAT